MLLIFYQVPILLNIFQMYYVHTYKIQYNLKQ